MKKIFFPMACVLMMVYGDLAHSSVITFDYTAVVNYSTIGSVIPVGTPVSGKYSFDSNISGVVVNSYVYSYGDWNPNNSFVASLSSMTFSGFTGDIVKWFNSPYNVYEYAAAAADCTAPNGASVLCNGSGPMIGNMVAAAMNVMFYAQPPTKGPQPYYDASLPLTPPSISLWDSLGGSATFKLVFDDPAATSPTGGFVQGNLTSLTLEGVPEPSSMMLFGGGLVLMAWGRRYLNCQRLSFRHYFGF